MSKFDEMHVRWTVSLVDPLKTDPVGDGSGFTPQEAMKHLREHLAWKENSERERVGRITAALEFALRDDSASVPLV